MAMGEEGNNNKEYRGEQIRVNNDPRKPALEKSGCC